MKENLNAQEKQMAAIAATTATGNIAGLKTALNTGLDAGLTVNQIKEILVQMYAYAGFPRSLSGIGAFAEILNDRKAKGIEDEAGKEATVIPDAGDKYERGRKVLEILTKQPQPKPAKGAGEFSPVIDRFLKEHLFADIFDSGVLTYRQRELCTISALAAMPGVEPMLQAHMNMGMNTGLTEQELNDALFVIENSISITQAGAARVILGKVLSSRTNN